MRGFLDHLLHLLGRAGIRHTGMIALIGIIALAPFVVTATAQAYSAPVVWKVSAIPSQEIGPGAAIRMSISGSTYQCTLGIPWVDGKGKAGWITAGHCGPTGTSILLASNGQDLGIAQRSEDAQVDLSFVPSSTAKGDHDLAGRALTGTATVRVGDLVCVQGVTTSLSCGWKVVQDVGEHEVAGRTMTGVLLEGKAQTCVSPGDSGGPVFILGTGEVKLVGVLNASGQTVDLGPIIPGTCRTLFTSIEQIQAALGGQMPSQH